MKKVLLMGLAAAAMLASCSNDETVEMAQQKAIGFESFVNKSTRGIANDIDKTNITNFSVYGFMENEAGIIFSDEAVTGSGETWSYNNTQYWTAGKDYWFSAIAPDQDANWTYDVNGKTTGGIITFDNKTGEQDLLYAYSDMITCTEPATQGKVGFTFNHLLSRVKFNFKNTMGNDNTKLLVKDVVITDANSKATCDVEATDKVWNLAADNVKGSLAFTANTNKIENTKELATDHKYMIPQNQKYTLKFTVEVYQGDVLAATYNHENVEVPSVDMKAGYSYVFNAELNGENVNPDGELHKIEFTVTDVNEWEEFGTGTPIPGYPETTEP